MKYSFIGNTDVGLVRQANEDSIGHQDMPWGKVVVLCDGMGGHRGGATASGIAVRCILEFFNSDEIESIPDALEQSVSFANEQIFATALDDPDLKGMGTTCVVLVQKEEEIWLAHVGDSRAYLHQARQLHRLTRDHSFVQQLVDSGAISDEEAEKHPRKNELLSALGIRPEVTVEVTSEAILVAPGSTILLCSDGLNGMINDDQIRKLMSSGKELSQICGDLIEAAKQGGGTDNISVQLLRVEQSVHSKSRFIPILPPPDRVQTNPKEEPISPTETPAGFNRTAIFMYGIAGFFVLIAAVVLFRMFGSFSGKVETAEQAEEVAVKRLIHVYAYYNSGYGGAKGKNCEKSLYEAYEEGNCKIQEKLPLKCIEKARKTLPVCGGKAPAPKPKEVVGDSTKKSTPPNPDPPKPK